MSAFRHLSGRPALLTGLITTLASGALAAWFVRPVTAGLIGWNVGIVAYGIVFAFTLRNTTPKDLQRRAAFLDEGRWAVLIVTVAAMLASLCAIVVELAQTHGKPGAGLSQTLAGVTVLLSWFFIHAIFATHYAHEHWRDGVGLSFPGNGEPGYSEFLYFSYCIAVASQVSDVATQDASMRKLVLAHSILSYFFNAAVIALGVNIAASLAS